MKKTFEDIIFGIINTTTMTIMSLLTAYPFFYMIFYSLSNPNKAKYQFLLYPKDLTIKAFKLAFESAGIPHALLISVLRSVIGPVITLTVISMAAYVLSKEKLVGRKILLKYFIITMYLNSGIIPTYLWFKTIGITGTFWVYVLPSAISVFYMILVKTYIEGIPLSMEEAARIDGAKEFTIFLRVIFPMCKPVIAAVGLFLIVSQWNMYIDTMLYNAEKTELHPLQYVLINFVVNKASSSLEQYKLGTKQEVSISTNSLKMAITVITIIPIMMVYPFLQKYFVKGILIGAIKG